jgi:multidrug efflux pump subunit AcrB
MKNWSLRTTLTNRWRAASVVGVAVLVFVAACLGFGQLPLIMYPKADGLKLGITVELSPASTLESAQRVADRLGEALRTKDYFESVVKLVGKKSALTRVTIQDALAPSEGEQFVGFSCMFVPREQRAADGYVYADQLRDELRPLLDELAAGASLDLVPETGQPNPQAPVQIALLGADMTRLRARTWPAPSPAWRCRRAGSAPPRVRPAPVDARAPVLPRRRPGCGRHRRRPRTLRRRDRIASAATAPSCRRRRRC